jgi:hypothetical protein
MCRAAGKQADSTSKKVIEATSERSIILEYSAMKNNEKYTVGYSVLNPATNSDSHSTKSNGARVVSPSIHIR